MVLVMGDCDDESGRTLWVGNLHENVTEEILYELFLQAGPLERVVLPAGKRYAFITFQHKESVLYSKELMEGVQLFGQYLKMQPRSHSSNSNPTGYNNHAPQIQTGVQNLMSPPAVPPHSYRHGQQMYPQVCKQYPNAQYPPMLPPDVERLNRLQRDIQRQLSHLPAMGQQQLQHQHQYQHQQQYQQSHRYHNSSQCTRQSYQGYH